MGGDAETLKAEDKKGRPLGQIRRATETRTEDSNASEAFKRCRTAMEALRGEIARQGDRVRGLKAAGVGGFSLQPEIDELLRLKALFLERFGVPHDPPKPAKSKKRPRPEDATPVEAPRKAKKAKKSKSERQRPEGAEARKKETEGTSKGDAKDRGLYSKKLSRATYDAESQQIRVTKHKGAFSQTMGIQRRDGHALMPEEALHLLEIGALALQRGEKADAMLDPSTFHRAISVAEPLGKAAEEAVGTSTSFPWAQYRTYCWLKRYAYQASHQALQSLSLARRELVPFRRGLLSSLRAVPRDVPIDVLLAPFSGEAMIDEAAAKEELPLPFDAYVRDKFAKRTAEPTVVAFPFKYALPVPFRSLRKMSLLGAKEPQGPDLKATVVATDGTLVAFDLSCQEIEDAYSGTPPWKRKKKAKAKSR
eukprot:scaffold1617_cov252-Pinguiococcus_pyrenoidosus.AAC.14